MLCEILKKYPLTFREFEHYMEKFDTNNYCFYPDEITASDTFTIFICKLPKQFLIGCLIEFLEENEVYINLTGSHWDSEVFTLEEYSLLGPKEEVFEKAFEILEENNAV